MRATEQLDDVLAATPQGLMLSLGVVDGRNVWKNEFSNSLELIAKAVAKISARRVMVAPSCSLLHVPHDLALETDEAMLLAVVKNWLAFARQRLD